MPEKVGGGETQSTPAVMAPHAGTSSPLTLEGRLSGWVMTLRSMQVGGLGAMRFSIKEDSRYSVSVMEKVARARVVRNV